MAKVEKDADDGDEAKPAAAPKSSLKKIILIAVGAVVLIGTSVGGTMLATGAFSKPDPQAAKKAGKKNPAKAAEDVEDEAREADEEKTEGEGEGEAEGEDELNPDGTPKAATYLDFEQPFVVNFMDEGHLRYLQISVSVMAKDPKVVEEVKRHMPLIRNNLVMLFSGQSRDVIITRDGKEKIRKDAEAEVQTILTAQTGKAGIKSLYFTSFVMQ